MKMRLMVMIVLTAAMIGGGTGAVLAGHGPGAVCDGPPPRIGMEMGPGGFDERMVKVLKLTETQQSQIRAIFDTEREQVKALFDRMHEGKKKLMQAGEAVVFDESAVRVIAGEQAAIEVELIVSRIGMQSRINALLTPEQRELLKIMRPEVR